MGKVMHTSPARPPFDDELEVEREIGEEDVLDDFLTRDSNSDETNEIDDSEEPNSPAL